MKTILKLSLLSFVCIFSVTAFASNHGQKRKPASGGASDPAISACQGKAEEFIKKQESNKKADLDEISLIQNRAINMGDATGPGVAVVPSYLNFEYWVDQGSSGDPVVYEMAFIARYDVKAGTWKCDDKPAKSAQRSPLGFDLF
jgi:hypothetical protein